jgi:hypothetical protein
VTQRFSRRAIPGKKVEEYFAIGVEQVWIIEPANRAVLVYRSPTTVRKYGEEEALLGEGVLEGLPGSSPRSGQIRRRIKRRGAAGRRPGGVGSLPYCDFPDT